MPRGSQTNTLTSDAMRNETMKQSVLAAIGQVVTVSCADRPYYDEVGFGLLISWKQDSTRMGHLSRPALLVWGDTAVSLYIDEPDECTMRLAGALCAADEEYRELDYTMVEDKTLRMFLPLKVHTYTEWARRFEAVALDMLTMVFRYSMIYHKLRENYRDNNVLICESEGDETMICRLCVNGVYLSFYEKFRDAYVEIGQNNDFIKQKFEFPAAIQNVLQTLRYVNTQPRTASQPQ
jgi:hypothetical protein